jgi:site-specific recombinase XerD
MTLKDAVRQFFFYRMGNGCPKTAKMYRDYLECLPYQEMEIQQVTLPMIQKYLASLIGLAPATKNLRKAMLRTFFRWLIDAGHLQTDPTRLLKNERSPMKEAAYMTTKEVRQFRQALQGTRHELLFNFYLQTGVRLSEALALNIGDVRGKKSCQVIGKGQKARQIFLAPLSTSLIGKTVNGSTAPTQLFSSYRGNRLSVSGVQGLFKKYLAKAGINPDKYHVHSLRHTYLTEVYKRTKNLRLVQELAGHSSPVTTARYCHVGEKEKIEAVQNLYA